MKKGQDTKIQSVKYCIQPNPLTLVLRFQSEFKRTSWHLAKPNQIICKIKVDLIKSSWLFRDKWKKNDGNRNINIKSKDNGGGLFFSNNALLMHHVSIKAYGLSKHLM